MRKIVGKDSIYKLFWVGNSDGFGGVGVLLAEIEKIIDVKRVNSRIMVIKILVGQTELAVVSTYAPLQGLEDSVKNKYYDELLATTSKFNARELVIIGGDLNGHVGKASDGYEGIHKRKARSEVYAARKLAEEKRISNVLRKTSTF